MSRVSYSTRAGVESIPYEQVRILAMTAEFRYFFILSKAEC
jgi:hypothetical protein